MKWLLAGCVAGFLLACLALMIVYSITYRAPAGEEQPKVTDWMQGWGSIAGVFAGLAAAGAAGLLLRHEMGEARRTRQELTLVAPRAVVSRTPTFTYNTTNELRRVRLDVDNYGPQAIRRLYGLVTLPDGYGLVLKPIDVVPPGSQAELDFNLDRAELWQRRVVDRPDARVTLRFFDGYGQEWERVDNGEPERAAGPPLFIDSLLISNTSTSDT